MKARKIVLVMTVLCLIAAQAVFAGGGAQKSGSGSGDKIVLKHWRDSGGEEELAYLRQFEQTHPNVTLEISVFEAQDYKVQSRLALASGTKPDVWSTNTGTFLDQFIEAGGALDLSGYVSQYKWAERMDKSFMDVGRRNGKLYALITGGTFTWQVLYANKGFFQRTGIPYPKTVDDMINTARQIRAAGMQPIAFGNKDGWPGQIILGDYMAQVAEADFADKLNGGAYHWDNRPELKTALEAMQKLAKGGAFVDGYATNDMNVGGTQTWLAGKAAFLYCGTWFYGPDVQEMLDFEVETIALSLVNANTKLKSIQAYPDGAIMVNPDTKYKDMAVAYLDHCAGDGFYEIGSRLSKVITPSPAINAKRDVPAWLAAEPITSQFKLPMYQFWTTQFPLPVEEALSNNVKMVFDGSISIDQALKNIEAEHARNR